MDSLVKTDIGLITRDNANWLFQQGIITREGDIKFNLKDGMIEKKAQMYSYFRWVIDDIKEKIPSAPKQVCLEIDDVIDIARLGEINKPYKVGGQEFHYMAKYPKVDSIYNVGRKACLEHQKSEGKGKKKELPDFGD